MPYPREKSKASLIETIILFRSNNIYPYRKFIVDFSYETSLSDFFRETPSDPPRKFFCVKVHTYNEFRQRRRFRAQEPSRKNRGGDTETAHREDR
jgi:hypothetical protein